MTFFVTAKADTSAEPTETAIATIGANTNYVLGSPASGTVNIIDNPPAKPTVTLVTTDDVATELSLTSGTFELRRTGDTSSTLVVNLTWTGTGALGGDYTLSATGGTISADGLTATFAAGSATMTIFVTAKADTTAESTETAVATVGTNTNYLVGSPASGTVNIIDNPPAKPTVTLVTTDAVATELGLTSGTFELRRTGDASATLVVNLTWAGTGVRGTDYTLSATGGTISADGLTATFAAGSATMTIFVTAKADTTAEPTETVIATIGANANYVVGSPASGTVNITDNPPASAPTVRVADATITEADRKTTNVTITLTLSAPSSSTVTVTLTTANGSAVAGSDYTATTKTVSFAPGQTTVTFTIAVVGDKAKEATESFFVNITSVSGGGATIADGQGLVTIIDNDGALTAESVGDGDMPILASPDATSALAAAIESWVASGIARSVFDGVVVLVTDLPGGKLAEVAPDGRTIFVDDDAAGWGWHTDPTTPVPADRIDLLTALLHELGHIAGLDHTSAYRVMRDVLEPGLRVELPAAAAATTTAAAAPTARDADRGAATERNDAAPSRVPAGAPGALTDIRRAGFFESVSSGLHLVAAGGALADQVRGRPHPSVPAPRAMLVGLAALALLARRRQVERA
jgi:hypothetical protein